MEKLYIVKKGKNISRYVDLLRSLLFVRLGGKELPLLLYFCIKLPGVHGGVGPVLVFQSDACQVAGAGVYFVLHDLLFFVVADRRFPEQGLDEGPARLRGVPWLFLLYTLLP